jgi:hypothetical protein
MFICSGLSFIAMKWEAKFLVALLFFILPKYILTNLNIFPSFITIPYLRILKQAAVMFPSHQFTQMLCCE